MANSAKRDSNGTWYIQFRYTDWTGTKRKSSKRGFRTKKEAEDWLSHFLLQQASDPSMTLSDFWDIYKTDMSKRLKETTMDNKEYLMNQKILPYFGTTPINEITPAKIRKWQGEMMGMGFKPTYLRTINNQLSAILNYVVSFYDFKSNPCKKAGSMGKGRADERPYWTLEEFRQFLDAVSDKHESWIGFQILFWTGIRVGELLALKVEDIDLENKVITIDESYTRLKQKGIISTPKTENSIRQITIHDELALALQEYMACLYKPRPGSRLFPERTKRFFEHEMERGIELSGVKKITVHCLRHSHASLLVDMGISPLAISKRLGHEKVTTTIETYCHPSADAQFKIADALGKVNRGEEDALREKSKKTP
ncbi:MAG: site-specific integrase [Spirochaetia bacterium]|jgi:integrase|nr:site-specific integrase [Spirochaetia bacterium]